MLSQALRTRQNTFICRLHIHRHFNHTSSSTSRESDFHYKRRCAIIRTWEPFHNLADTWTLLRAVEHMYGQVIEARFFKDYEVNNRYEMETYVVFRDKESKIRIPKTGRTFRIPALVTEDRPGGLGLDDIEYLLESTDRDETFEFPSAGEIRDSKRIIWAKIERSHKDLYTTPDYTPAGPGADMAFAEHFLRWGGFHELIPIKKLDSDIMHKVWHEQPQLRMRFALQRCSQYAGLPDPGIIQRPSVIKKKGDGKVSDSSPGSASMDSPTPNIPNSTQSRSLPTKPPQSTLQTLLELTKLPPKPTPPESTIPPPGQLTPEQQNEAQMSQAKEPVAKQAAMEAQMPDKGPEEGRLEDQMAHVPNKSPEEPLQPRFTNIVAKLWKLLGR